ncbi:hypothetical protein PCK1_002581 [Pneumocystis canis]|nr:hypothetical protein PCK1_002581 [Pneumocystis canis]
MSCQERFCEESYGMIRYGFTGNTETEDPFIHERTAGNAETDADHQELRRVTLENISLSMEELANKVRDEECGAQSEKYRQVFGISWLMRHCEAVPDVAVPRNRIYAHYVSICAHERIKPLNPASFGKLVRMVYPDIKTRRLGVRGQSKYHYCGMKLRDENLSSHLNVQKQELKTPEHPTFTHASMPSSSFLKALDPLLIHYLGLCASGPVPLPKRIERWTVPRGPFAHAKSKENFERITHKRLITIKDGHPHVVDIWLAYLTKHVMSGIGMKAHVFRYETIEQEIEDNTEELAKKS